MDKDIVVLQAEKAKAKFIKLFFVFCVFPFGDPGDPGVLASWRLGVRQELQFTAA